MRLDDHDVMPSLTPYDRRWVSWEVRIPASRGTPEPFDRAAATAVAGELLRQPAWQPRLVTPPRALGRDAATFWFLALTSRTPAEIQGLDLARGMTVDDVVRRAVASFSYSEDATALLLVPLANLFGATELLDMILDERSPVATLGNGVRTLRNGFSIGFCDHVAPFCDAGEFAACRARVRAFVAGNGDATRSTWLAHLAAALHLPGLVMPFADALPPGHRHDGNLFPERLHIVYGLGSRERVLASMKRMQLRLFTAQDLREWFALTSIDGIAYAFTAVADYDFDVPERVDALGTVQTVETATAMFGMTTRRTFSAAAKAWLDRHPHLTIPAAVEVVAKPPKSTGKRRDAAVEALKRAAALGHTEMIAAAVGDDLRELVLGRGTSSAASGGHELAWLDDALPKSAKPLRWLYADALPPLVVDGAELDERRVSAVIEALGASTLQAPDARVRALKRHAQALSAERFALALLAQWLRAGANAPDKWALYAVGLLGGDEAATALVPYVRRWPGESQHARAVIGLECLRAIGSDVALTQIAGLAQKLSFAALKRRANECIEEIAHERGLTRERLEDRVVPRLDLDGGERRFTLRGTVYAASVNAALEPVLRDGEGKIVRDFPKPAAADGADDDDVRAAWKLFKKQLRDVAAVQRGRLEAAMVAQRSWFADEFTTLLVAHPILGPLVRQLVWIAESPNAEPPLLFRVRDDGATVDAGDVPIGIPASASMRLVHRLELDENTLAAWETRFTALRVVQPFAQLDRVTYRLDEIELASDGIRRFDGNPVAEPTVMGRLRARGWQRGQPEDGGAYTHHWKHFERAGVTAIVQHGMIVIGYAQPDASIAIEGCFFVRGPALHRGPSDELVPLRDVPAVPLSEVCADCAFVLS